MRIFAEGLKKERLYKGLTQRQMAENLGISLRTYQGYESLGKASRNPNFETLVKIAKILAVSTDELLTEPSID